MVLKIPAGIVGGGGGVPSLSAASVCPDPADTATTPVRPVGTVRTNALPHTATVQFYRRESVAEVALYLQYSVDESYTLDIPAPNSSQPAALAALLAVRGNDNGEARARYARMLDWVLDRQAATLLVPIVVIALVLDLTFFPALLLRFDRKRGPTTPNLQGIAATTESAE